MQVWSSLPFRHPGTESSAVVCALCHAAHAACGSRVGFESPRFDIFATDEALAVFASLETPQRTVDARQLFLPPAGGFLGHLLSLHRVHAGQSADARLVELHGLMGLSGGLCQIFELRFQLQQASLRLVGVRWHRRLLVGLGTIESELPQQGSQDRTTVAAVELARHGGVSLRLRG